MASVSPRGSRYEVGDEPVPGYRLEKWIGEGAMGEVWQASSAGGIKVALKIIYRLDQRGGRKEFPSL
jgi:hypothetical protein